MDQEWGDWLRTLVSASFGALLGWWFGRAGARIQSAASRLQLDGADVIAAIAVGRIVHPDFSDETQALWDGAKAQPFDFDVCCL